MAANKRNPSRSRQDAESKFNALLPEERIQFCLDQLPGFLDEWEKKHPHWELEALLWIVSRSFKTLRHYIESREEPDISWESPFVELRFPVGVMWENNEAGPPYFRFQTGNITESVVSEWAKIAPTLAEILVEHVQIVALQNLTSGAAFEEYDGELRPVLDREITDLIKSKFEPSEVDKEIRKLFWPVSFGAGHVVYQDPEEGSNVDAEAMEQLAAIREPLISIPFDAEGHKMRVITVLEINPPVAVVGRETGYFPVVVGLAIQCCEDGADALSILEEVDFIKWPKEELTTLWEALDTFIDTALKSLSADLDEEMVEAVISVNAQVKVCVPKNSQSQINEAINDIIEKFHQTGQVMAHSFRIDGRNELPDTQRKQLRDLLSEVVESSSSLQKGKALEDLTAALFSTVPGFTVTERVRTKSEEIDLWVANTSAERPFSDEGDLILAECKNWTKKCGKNELVLFTEKLRNRGGRSSIGYLISWNGFARTVTIELLRASRERTLVALLDGNDLTEAVDSGDFLSVLKRSRHRAVII